MGLSEKKKKAAKADIDDALNELCIVEWDTEFRVLFQSDDMGEHAVVAFEGEVPVDSKDKIKTPYMGWRVIRMQVPEGYLSAFYPLGS
tara:strand:+ start:197 stop:460 length:264 start_codon:yes stop_codon:yes gene_type:complete